MKTKKYQSNVTLDAAQTVSADVKGVITLDTGTKKNPETIKVTNDMVAQGFQLGDYLSPGPRGKITVIKKAEMEANYTLAKTKPAPKKEPKPKD